ncbi:hypothetical protein QBC36DRAFT_330032 [Triangularia setosa]|uniref:Uncharacterized protein n=1 Tax=Triangularia setosa TaxID=2587417 RepID=A0AAN6W8I4_9PEZI|nr:hypothetical protein QBC36DRAFT_330032 [Podospora setosa]
MGSPVGNNLRKRKSLESHQDGREKRVAVDAEGEDMVVDGRGEDVDLNFDIDAELEPRVESPAQEEAENIHQSIELDDQPHISSPLSSPPILNDENDPDLAPPMSSGPASEAASPIAWPSLNTLAQKKYNTRTIPTKTPELDDDDVGSNISSPPSLTHSPNYRSAKAKPAVARKKAPPPPKSSADLASLLPRRKASSKNKNRKGSDAADPFDLDDGEASEEEAPPPARRAAAKKPFSKATSTANKGKQKADVFAADPKGERKKRVARTYGSRVHEQDRENDDNIDAEREESIVVGSGSNEPEEEEEELPEAETTVMLTERLGEELQKAVKKFKEVDQWELSFEEVSGSSSPMRDAR